MKTNFRYQVFLFFAILITAGFIASDDPLQNILAQLEKYHTSYSPEKIHLHFDKPIYAAGDTIWFKAYTVNAEKNQLSNLSKTMYVDLIDESDSVKQTLKLPIDAGVSWGNFTLADTVKEGNYRVRAYTNWMRNFSNNYFFDKTFEIGSSFSDRVNANINYQLAETDHNTQVNATVNYKDMAGNPMANKKVSYEIHSNASKVITNKGITDGNGLLRINFPVPASASIHSFIVTHLKIDEKNDFNKSFPVSLISENVDVQFFPEGGSLVDGIKSKVAFKALGSDGKGTPIAGSIIDKNGVEQTSFITEHAGMGSFSLLPQTNQLYKARVKFKDGSEKLFSLPEALANGYTLSVQNDAPDNLNIQVKISPATPFEGQVTVVAQMNGVVKYVSKSAVNNNLISAKISKSRFPDGILHLTLFSPDNGPVAERLVFINNAPALGIALQTDKNIYTKREKVKMELVVKDAAGNPVSGSFSLAVTNEQKVQSNEADEKTIISNLLLISDLKGYIEQPNYYFTASNLNKAKYLDLLMLTQGWSRFVWKDLLADKFPDLPYLPEKGIVVSGKVTRGYGQAIAGGQISLHSFPGNKLVQDTTISEKGRFRFDSLFFTDTTRLLLLALNKKGNNNVNIELDKPTVARVSVNRNLFETEPNVNQSMETYLQNSKDQFDDWKLHGLFKRTIVLKEVTIKDKKLSKVQEALKASQNFNGPGSADQVITYMDLRNYHDLTTALEGKVAGMSIIRNKNGNQAYLRGNAMRIILDGFVSPITLEQIDVHNIQTIEVLKTVGYLAVYGGSAGVLVITTKRGGIDFGDDADSKNGNGSLYYTLKGYDVGKQFYSPVYPNPAAGNVKDLRTTVYWQPNIITDKDGKATFEYYNADGTGQYKATVEGLSIDGKLGRFIATYTVK